MAPNDILPTYVESEAMDGLCGLVVLVMEASVDNRHGAVERISATEVALSDAHLLNELGVLLVQLNIGEFNKLIDTLNNAPLQGVQEHLHGIIQVPLASTNELLVADRVEESDRYPSCAEANKNHEKISDLLCEKLTEPCHAMVAWTHELLSVGEVHIP
jgi:hypothetical protein